jgi:hypothetical protein
MGEFEVKIRCSGGRDAEIGRWSRKSKQWFFGGWASGDVGFSTRRRGRRFRIQRSNEEEEA